MRLNTYTDMDPPTPIVDITPALSHRQKQLNMVLIQCIGFSWGLLFFASFLKQYPGL